MYKEQFTKIGFHATDCDASNYLVLSNVYKVGQTLM